MSSPAIYITNLVQPHQQIRVIVPYHVSNLSVGHVRLDDLIFKPRIYGAGHWYHYSIGYYGDSGYVELKRVNLLEMMGKQQ